MNYADIKQFDVANGPGVRVSLFVSGCTHHCEGCFNQVAWDFNYGTPFTEETANVLVEYLKPNHIAGITILGGEPLEPCNRKELLPLLKRIKEEYPDKSVWMFTGYDFEKDVVNRMFKEDSITEELFSYVDMLVDGKFELTKKSMGLRFRGSSNQRIIKVQESLTTHQVVLWEGMN